MGRVLSIGGSPVLARCAAGLVAVGLLAAGLLASGSARAQEKPAASPNAASPKPLARCVLVVDAASGKDVHRQGDCATRHAPQSTFKVPLALIGFETGLLKGPHDPVWAYDGSFTAPARDYKDVDPTIWERDSVVWFSRELVKRLAARDGAASFGAWVTRLGYGNQDVSGDKGKNNGLTHAWLSSSLKISPDEQTVFIRRLLGGDLPASPRAMAQTREIIPIFIGADGWTVQGKTGSTALTKTANGRLGHGWFVGWARKDGRTLVFAVHEQADGLAEGDHVGPRLRSEVLRDLPGWAR